MRIMLMRFMEEYPSLFWRDIMRIFLPKN